MSNRMTDSFFRKFFEKNDKGEFFGDSIETFEDFCNKAWNGAFIDYKWLSHHFTLLKRLRKELSHESFNYMSRNVVLPEVSKIDDILESFETDDIYKFKRKEGKRFFHAKMQDDKHGDVYGHVTLTEKARGKHAEIYGYGISSVEFVQWCFKERNYFLAISKCEGGIGACWLALVEDDGRFNLKLKEAEDESN